MSPKSATSVLISVTLLAALSGCDPQCTRCRPGTDASTPDLENADGGVTPAKDGAAPSSDLLPAPDAGSWPTAAEQNERLGHGINLGNMLEAPVEGEWGVSVKQHYAQVIKEGGFDSVRIPIRWSAHAASDPPYTIDSVFAARVDEVVGWVLEQDLAAIINIHHYEEIHQDPSGHRARFLALWEQIAPRFQNAPPQLAFELLNEPNGALTPQEWNPILAEALAVVRQSNPRRTVLVGTANWGGIGGLNDLVLPADDNIIVTVHFYSPFWFTHSGADWAGDQPAGAVWSGTDPERNELRQELQIASDWSSQHGVPIHVGEFGAYSQADQASRVLWTAFIVEEFNTRGFAWAYWEFCAGFGAYDPDAEAWRDDLLGALAP